LLSEKFSSGRLTCCDGSANANAGIFARDCQARDANAGAMKESKRGNIMSAADEACCPMERVLAFVKLDRIGIAKDEIVHIARVYDAAEGARLHGKIVTVADNSH
jgi:hypothetical protein